MCRTLILIRFLAISQLFFVFLRKSDINPVTSLTELQNIQKTEIETDTEMLVHVSIFPAIIAVNLLDLLLTCWL